MCWYNYSTRRCISCGYEYQLSNDTLTINKGIFCRCPKCDSETKLVKLESRVNNFVEKLNKSFRRV